MWYTYIKLCGLSDNVGMRVSVAICYVSKYCWVFVVPLINYMPYHVSRILCAMCVSIVVTCISVLLSF